MASQTTEEILKFVVQAGGNESLTPIVRSILDLSGNSAEAEKAVGDLLTQLADSQKLTTTLEQYKKVGATVLDLSKRYDEAKLKVAELGKSLSATDEPTKKQQQEFERARTALAKLGTQYENQLEKLRGYRSELSAAGVSTSNFSAAQAQLKARATEVSTALTGMATAAKKTKDEQVALAARLADGDEAFRRQAEASKSAREALDRVKASTTAAADAQSAAAAKSTILGAAWTKLAAIGATLVGYLSLSAAVDGVKNLLGLADASEKTRLRLAALYGSAEAGNAAFAKLRDIAKANGLEFAGTAEAATKLKSFGIDPLNGSLQALIDQNARLGGSQETLNGIILAVGQAWAKQKLQGEEILQLVERGVPVWDLLSKATGKNVTELQKLSEAGKLGRTEITALVREIGASAEGAAAQNLGTFGGLIVQIKDQWQQFLQAIADAGVLKYAKDQISALIDEAKRLAADGTLAQWAKSTADAITTVANIIVGSVKLVVQYSGALYELAKAFAAIKIGQLLVELGLFATKLGLGRAGLAALAAQALSTNVSFGALSAGIARLPALVRLGIVSVGVELVLSQIGSVLDAYSKLEEAQRRLNTERVDERNANEALRGQLQGIKDLFVSYADIAIKSTKELADLNSGNAQSYETALQNAQKYYRALELDARRAGDAVALGQAQAKLREITAELALVGERVKETAGEAEKLTARVGEFGRTMAAQFLAAKEAGTDAAAAISTSFNSLDLTTGSGLTNALDAIRAITGLSKDAGLALEDNLRAKLAKLSNEDFEKFKAAAIKAFGASSEKARELDKAIAGINLARLGVDVDALKSGFNDAGQSAIDAFAGAIDEVGKLGLTAEQQSTAIARAFDSAFARAGTRPELEALRNQLNQAFSEGKISATEYADRLAQLNGKLDELANKTTPATNNTREMAGAMRDAASAADETTASADDASKSIRDMDASAQSIQVSLGDMSQALIDQAMAMQAQARSGTDIIKVWEGVTDAYNDQNRMVENRLAMAQRVIDANDEEGRSLTRLGNEYDAISNDKLKRLLDLERKAAEIRRKRATDTTDAAKAEREFRQEVEQTAASAQSSSLEYTRRIAVDVNVRADASAGSQTLSQAVLDQIVAKITPTVTRAVLDQIAHDQSAAGH